MWLLPDYGPLKEYDCRQIFYDSENKQFWYRKVSNSKFYNLHNKFSCQILEHFSLFQRKKAIHREITWSHQNHSIPQQMQFLMKEDQKDTVARAGRK